VRQRNCCRLTTSHRVRRCARPSDSCLHGDWLSLLAALNHEQVAERLHWLATLLLDALKVQQGATLLTNMDAIAGTPACQPV
jgi:hypothetical protein